MDIFDIIEAAKLGQTLLPPSDKKLLHLKIDGEPSHRMTNSVAGFRAEMQSLLLRPLQIVGGGEAPDTATNGLEIFIDLVDSDPDELEKLEKFVADSANKMYFNTKYRITSLGLASS